MSATSVEPELELQETLGDADGEPDKRLLIIVNPYATTVSDRLRNLVIYALRGSYEVDAVDTERRDHATELVREAAAEGYDAVVAFGGDGTVNEAANGLIGSDTPLTCLPGGKANVYCRMLGIPPDVVDATEHLLSLADNWRTRVVDLGRAGDRHFLFSAGVGLDAEVVRHVDAHPRLKSRFGEYYYSWVAARTFSRHYLLHPPRLEASLAGGEDSVRGATVIVQNSSPYAYFGDRAVEMAEGARLDSGDLAWLALKRTSPFDMPTIAWRALSSHRRVIDHRQIVGFSEQASVRVRSLDDRPLPLQVDGDYIGRFDEIEFSVVPAALKVLA